MTSSALKHYISAVVGLIVDVVVEAVRLLSALSSERRSVSTLVLASVRDFTHAIDGESLFAVLLFQWVCSEIR